MFFRSLEYVPAQQFSRQLKRNGGRGSLAGANQKHRFSINWCRHNKNTMARFRHRRGPHSGSGQEGMIRPTTRKLVEACGF